jgi:hypothetical protein
MRIAAIVIAAFSLLALSGCASPIGGCEPGHIICVQ